MNKVYSDSTGINWMMFDVNSQRCPNYDIPDQCHLKIREYIQNCLSPYSISRNIPLPYFSVPMWVIEPCNISSILNYSYCICCECGLILDTPGQLVIILSLGVDDKQVLSMTWRVGLRGMCCKPELLENTSYYPFISYSQKQLTPTIEKGWSTFNIDSDECSLYECTHLECKLAEQILNNNALNCTDLVNSMNDLTWHFYITKLDVLSPLLYGKCSKTTCGIPLKYVSDIKVCDKCRRMSYCSDKCIEEHYCKLYYDIWLG